MIAFTNCKIITITNGVIEKGTILFDEGTITAVGDLSVSIPNGAEVRDLSGKWVMPGLIDCHTHLSNFFEPRMLFSGQSDANECSDPTTPQIRAMDALNPFDPAFLRVRNAGFTTCCTLPGSGNIIGGTGIAYKIRGTSAEEMMIPGTEQMKMALGENAKSAYGPQRKMPMTRMGNAAVMRKILSDAINYGERKVQAEKEGKVIENDFMLEALQKVVKGEQRVRIHSHRSDDILTACRISEEFNLDYCIDHCTEGYKIVDILVAKNPFCVIGPAFMEPYKQEIWGIRLENAGILAKAGLRVCLTADTASHTCYLPLQIGLLMAYGLSEEAAFKGVTIHPASLLGIEDRVGSLEVGKDADIAVFDGHPFSNFSRCQYTVIDGVVYENDQDSLLKIQ